LAEAPFLRGHFVAKSSTVILAFCADGCFGERDLRIQQLPSRMISANMLLRLASVSRETFFSKIAYFGLANVQGIQ
jgi:hypothetical protein